MVDYHVDGDGGQYLFGIDIGSFCPPNSGGGVVVFAEYYEFRAINGSDEF